MTTYEVAYWDMAKRLADKLYTASYPLEADKSRIEPLAMRAEWERELWLRVAVEALTELDT